MSVEYPSEDCAAYRDALVRLVCADASGSTAALRSHLASCAVCREELETGQELAGTLRDVLRPESLSEGFVQCLRQRLDAESLRARPCRRVRLGVALGAVAAGLAAALVVPPWLRQATLPTPHSSMPSGLSLSREDAAAILQTFTDLGWEGPTETSLGLLADRVEDLSQTLGSESKTQTALPWGRENDWDVPADGGGADGPHARGLLCNVACQPRRTSGDRPSEALEGDAYHRTRV
jgi:hypothetical protein